MQRRRTYKVLIRTDLRLDMGMGLDTDMVLDTVHMGLEGTGRVEYRLSESRPDQTCFNRRFMKKYKTCRRIED